MERLQSRRQQLSLLVGGTIAGLALGGCTSGEENRSHDGGPVGTSSRPDITCTSAGFFTDYGTDKRYLNVSVTNSRGRQIEADSAQLRELETQRTHEYELTDNKAPVSISKKAIQVAVSVEVDDFRFGCPTIYYPNRAYEAPEYTPSNQQ